MQKGFRRSNILYQCEYDGAIFKYKVRRPFNMLFKAFGLASKIEKPLNIMLGFKSYKFIGICVVRLYEHRFQIGQQSPKPLRVPLIVFFITKKPCYCQLESAVDENIIATREGRNVGLMFLDQASIIEFFEH